MIKGYYFITDSTLSKYGNINDVKDAIETGVNIIQYRNKNGSDKEFYEEAKLLKEICADKALFIINDRVDIAISLDADGLHIGNEDISYEKARNMLGDEKIIGVTVHNKEEALSYSKKGVSYLAVSPIFSTTTKEDAGKPVGINLIKEIRKLSSLPIVAIGGINLSNAKEVIAAGADSLCAISAVVAGDSVKEEIARFQRLFIV